MQIYANEVNGEAMKVVERITSTNSFVTQLQLSHRWLFISSIHWLCRKTGQPIRASVNDPSAILKRIPDALSHPMLKLKGSLRIVKPTSLKLWRMTESQRILKKKPHQIQQHLQIVWFKASGSTWKCLKVSTGIWKHPGSISESIRMHLKAFERHPEASQSICKHPDASESILKSIRELSNEKRQTKTRKHLEGSQKHLKASGCIWIHRSLHSSVKTKRFHTKPLLLLLLLSSWSHIKPLEEEKSCGNPTDTSAPTLSQRKETIDNRTKKIITIIIHRWMNKRNKESTVAPMDARTSSEHPHGKSLHSNAAQVANWNCKIPADNPPLSNKWKHRPKTWRPPPPSTFNRLNQPYLNRIPPMFYMNFVEKIPIRNPGLFKMRNNGKLVLETSFYSWRLWLCYGMHYVTLTHQINSVE